MTFTEIIINGVFNGFGTGIGSYLAVRYAIGHLEKLPTLKEKLEEVKGKARGAK